MKKPFTNCILGVNISITNMQEMINLILEQLEELRGQYVCFSNVHTTVMSYEDPEYRKVQNSAYVALPDGSPLSYVERIRGHKEARRVAGPDFMAEMWKATEHTEVKHYFYGSTQTTIDSLKECLEVKYPGLKIAGMESPPFRALTPKEDEEVIRRINESGADILWVGLGAPKQEKWMFDHKDKIHAVMMGVGAGFDFHAGIAKRAPMWMQTHYLEWLYRLVQDPKRLWKRYVNTNLRFLYLLLRYAWKGKGEDYDSSLSAKKHLLIYAHYYYPDVASTGQILTELAEGLKDSFRITVICAVPSYSGKIARKYRAHKYFYENINGIDVLRVRVPEFRKNFSLSRVYNISQYFLSAIAATGKVGKVDYVYSISQPPILGGLLGVIGKKVKKAKFVYNIQDFNPEQVLAVNYTKSRLVTDFMRKLDTFSCKQADKVIFVGRDMEETLLRRFLSKNEKEELEASKKYSDEMAERISQRNAEGDSEEKDIPRDISNSKDDSEKKDNARDISNPNGKDNSKEKKTALAVIRNLTAEEKKNRHIPSYCCINNWINEEEIIPLSPGDDEVCRLRSRYDLNNKFIFMYSGNLGLYYDLLHIIRVIEKFKDRSDVVFLFAGAGTVEADLKYYAQQNHLTNVVFMPYQSKERLVYSLNLADVHFVVNAKGIKGVSVPSKLYGVMAAGKPVLGILDEGSEARIIVEESGCGYAVAPGDYDAIERLIAAFMEKKNSGELTKMGMAGRDYLLKYLTKDISVEKYRKEILGL